MRKWGKILRKADTFDGDYLEKNKGGELVDDGRSGAAEVKALLLGGSALAALLFVSVQS